MRHKILFIITICFSIFFTSAQTDEGSKVNTVLRQVQDNIYMIQGKGGNIGLSIGDDGVLMIDSQFADLSEDILKDIKRINKKPIQFLVNTHHHADHTGGNVNMVKEGAVIVSHENVRSRLSDARKENYKKSELSDKRVLSTITFKDDITFHYNNETILVFHVHDAHTDGDAVVYFPESNVIHTGDILFNGKYPFIDTNNGGTLNGYLEALGKIIMMSDTDTKIIPGHGNIANKADLKAAGNMLSTLHKRVSFQYLNKKTEAEILRMRDITKEYDDLGYGDGLISTEKILKTIYNEVKKERGEIDRRDIQQRLDDKVKEYKKNNGSEKG